MSIHAEARKPLRNFWSFSMTVSNVRKVFLQKRHHNSFTWILTNSLSSEFPMRFVNVDDAVSNLLKLPPFDG